MKKLSIIGEAQTRRENQCAKDATFRIFGDFVQEKAAKLIFSRQGVVFPVMLSAVFAMLSVIFPSC